MDFVKYLVAGILTGIVASIGLAAYVLIYIMYGGMPEGLN